MASTAPNGPAGGPLMWMKTPSGNGTKAPLLRSRGSVASLLLQNRDRKGADFRTVLRRLQGSSEWTCGPLNGTKNQDAPLLRSRGSVVSLLLQNRDRKGADFRPVFHENPYRTITTFSAPISYPSSFAVEIASERSVSSSDS